MAQDRPADFIAGKYGGLAMMRLRNEKIAAIGLADVDTERERRLYTPHNEGGAPLATKSCALAVPGK